MTAMNGWSFPMQNGTRQWDAFLHIGFYLAWHCVHLAPIKTFEWMTLMRCPKKWTRLIVNTMRPGAGTRTPTHIHFNSISQWCFHFKITPFFRQINIVKAFYELFVDRSTIFARQLFVTQQIIKLNWAFNENKRRWLFAFYFHFVISGFSSTRLSPSTQRHPFPMGFKVHLWLLPHNWIVNDDLFVKAKPIPDDQWPFW